MNALTDLRLNPHLLGLPPYVPGRSIEEVQEQFGLGEVVKLASNENPLGPSPQAVAAFRAALQEAHRYPGVADQRLRQKLADKNNSRYQASFTEQNFIMGNGLTAILRTIGEAFIFEGGESVICTPTFPMYQTVTQRFGGKCIRVPHKNYRYDWQGMADAITPDTRLLFICNPNNPTGTLLRRDEVEALMARVPPSVVVVFDEPYCDFVADPNYSNAIDYVKNGRDQFLVLRSFSKLYGLANLRLGYALGTEAMIEYLGRARLPFETGDPVLCAAMAALEDEAYVTRVQKLIAAEKQFLYEGFAQMDLDYVPSEANYILLVNLPRPAQVINERLLQRGVIVRPMGSFGMPDALRVSIGTRAENECLLGALRQTVLD